MEFTDIENYDSYFELRKPLIIGLIGDDEDKKKEIVKLLTNVNFTHYSFADPLKALAANLGFKHAYGSRDEQNIADFYHDLSVTEFMKRIDSVCYCGCNMFGPKLSTKPLSYCAMEKRLLSHYDFDFPNIIIDDVTKLEQANLIKMVGGEIIEVRKKTKSSLLSTLYLISENTTNLETTLDNIIKHLNPKQHTLIKRINYYNNISYYLDKLKYIIPTVSLVGLATYAFLKK